MNNIQAIKLTPIMMNIPPMHKLARVAPISEGEEREGEERECESQAVPANGDIYDELQCRADKRTGRGELDSVIFDA